MTRSSICYGTIYINSIYVYLWGHLLKKVLVFTHAKPGEAAGVPGSPVTDREQDSIDVVVLDLASDIALDDDAVDLPFHTVERNIRILAVLGHQPFTMFVIEILAKPV